MSATLSPVLVKRLKTAKQITRQTDAGLPEYVEDVNYRRMIAMRKNRAKRFLQAFPTEAERQQYGAERLAYIQSFGKE